jgi:hypothetical protein
LITALLALADNWLGLVPEQLAVNVDNASVIAPYERLTV